MTGASVHVAYSMLWLARILGAGSAAAFVWFLLAGPPDLIDLGLGGNAALGLDGALCLAFFAQHSVMVRRSFRERLERVLPMQYHGALFSIVAGIVLLALVMFWQASDEILLSADSVRWLPRALGFASLAGLFWTGQAMPSFDVFGVKPILDRLHGTEPQPQRFVCRGPYRWVRHPAYLFMLLMIWSHPHLTEDRLLFNISWTIWIWLGTMLEERDLVSDFGDTYREYQRQVPMLIPFRIPRGSALPPGS